jgi:hypothetical protein
MTRFWSFRLVFYFGFRMVNVACSEDELQEVTNDGCYIKY